MFHLNFTQLTNADQPLIRLCTQTFIKELMEYGCNFRPNFEKYLYIFDSPPLNSFFSTVKATLFAAHKYAANNKRYFKKWFYAYWQTQLLYVWMANNVRSFL